MIGRTFADFDVPPIESYAVGETRLDGYGRRSEQHIFRFDNGYGASVIRSEYTYGGSAGLWELALIKFDDGDWYICYDSALIGDDVIGWLTDEAVAGLLRQIETLDAAP